MASELTHTPYDIVYLQDDSEVCDLAKYPVVIYPHPTIMDEKRSALLKDYVEQGGTLVIGCRSGYKDMNGRCVMLPQPGLLKDITGSDVRDFTFESPAEEAVWASCGGKRIEMPLFNDILEPLETAETVAVYENSYYAGKTAVTKKRLGEGTAVHFGSTFSRENLSWLFEYLGIKEPFAELISAPETLEVVLREKEGKRYLFVLNFQAEEAGFTLHKEMRMMYTGEMVQGEQKLPRFGTAVYEVM